MDNNTLNKLPVSAAKLYEPMLKTSQAALMLGVTPYFLYKDRVITNSHPSPLVPYVKVGRSVRYKLSDIQAFIVQNTQASAVTDTN